MTEARFIEKDLRIYSQNVQGINDPYKLDSLLELMDQRQADVIFLQETFRGTEQKSEDTLIHSSSKRGYALFEYKNFNSRRGIQFWISKDLDGIVLRRFCRKSNLLEVLCIKLGGIILVGAYIPEGYRIEGINELLEVIEDIESEGEDLLLLGDWNTKSSQLGNLSTNIAGRRLDQWMEEQEYSIYKPLEHTFRSRTFTSAVDVAMWKGPRMRNTRGEILKEVRSDHAGLLLHLKWSERSNPLSKVTYNIKQVGKLLQAKKESSQSWSAQEVEEVLDEYRSKQRSNRVKRRVGKYYLIKSKDLKKLERRVLVAKQTGSASYTRLREEAQREWRREKRTQFRKDLDTIIQSKDVRSFCRFMRNTSPKEVWSVNTGEGREEELMRQLIAVQEERPEIEAFIEVERERLQSLRFEEKDLLEVDEVQASIMRLGKRKAPGPSGLSYDHLKALTEKTTEILVEAMNNSLNQGNLPPSWFNLLIRPLAKKPGTTAIRPISLMESMVKILDKSFNQHLTQLAEQHDLISPKQFGFVKGRSATDQLVRLIDSIKLRKKAAVLLSVDLKGAYDRVSNLQLYERLKELVEPGWNYTFSNCYSRESLKFQQNGKRAKNGRH